jgi:putative flavoprotein involved in K+ transport
MSIPQEILGKTLWWWFKKIGFLSVSKFSFIGKKLSKGAQPIIGTDVKSILKKENVVCVGRTLDACKTVLTFEKGSYTDIKNVVWATGFKPNFSWIEGITLNASSYPKNYRGISDVEGLYFLGLPWLYTRGSATLGGVKKDTEFISNYIKKLEVEPAQTKIVLRKQLA